MNERSQHNPFESYDFNTTAFLHRTPDHLAQSARRNLTELAKLINRLFEYYSRLLVVRIDLGYKNEVTADVPLEVAQRHRQELLSDRWRYPEVFGHMVAYAWGFEHSSEHQGGYHYHFLAIYDGAHRRDDIGLGMAIRDLWNDITHGYGHCYISNFDKEKLAKQGCLGIGMIHRNDVPLRINLIEKVAAYITKKCSAFDIQSGRTASGDFRTFGKSWIPKPLDPNAPRRGRPPELPDQCW